MKRYWIATEILLLSMILKQRDKNSKENRKNEKKKTNGTKEKNSPSLPHHVVCVKTILFVLTAILLGTQETFSPRIFLCRNMWPIKRQANIQKGKKRLLKIKSLHYNLSKNHPFKYFSTVYYH